MDFFNEKFLTMRTKLLLDVRGKMKALGLILVTLTSLLVGCLNEEAVETINVYSEPVREEMNISQIAEEISLVQLQNDSGNVIGRVHSVIIRDKYIYVLDISSHSVLVFNRDGSFVSKLDRRGNGPGEYLGLGPVIVDEDESFLELITFSGEGFGVIKYKNISFDFVSFSPLPLITANSVRKRNDTFYFATQQIDNLVDGQKTNADLLILKGGEIVNKIRDKAIDTSGSGFSPFAESFVGNEKGELFASFMFDNNFYQINGMEARPCLALDFGKMGIDNEVGFQPLSKQLEYLAKSQGLASFPVLLANNENVLFFSYIQFTHPNDFYHESNYRFFIKSFDSGASYHTKTVINDLTDFPERFFSKKTFRGIGLDVVMDDYLVEVIVPAFHLNDAEMKKEINGLGEVHLNDNPIIAFIKLKDF